MPSAFPQLLPVVTAAGMRAVDQTTIQELGISGFTLMESAGRETVGIALEMLELRTFDDPHEPPAYSIVCVCGPGNNGGDGFVMARYLSGYGYRVTVIHCADSAPKGEAGAHFEILQKVAQQPGVHLRILQTQSEPTSQILATLQHLGKPDLVVDALLGTGLSSTVRPAFVPFIEWMNNSSSPILSVDVPSGLSVDTGAILGHCVNAHVTVTLGALKVGLLTNEGPDVVGALHVVDIGIPPYEVEKVCSDSAEIRISNNSFVSSLLPAPLRTDHKYTTGPSIVVAGSTKYTGAPVLAAESAARSGSAYVVCAAPQSIQAVLQEKLTEIPVVSWKNGMSKESAFHLISGLESQWTKAKSILIGPGLGREDGVLEFIQTLLQNHNGPAVLDADALHAFIGQREWVHTHSHGRWIFTPHQGEFQKLLGLESGNSTILSESHVDAARQFASQWNVVLLLKGFPSLVATPTGSVIINSTGQSSAATAGAGDVLGGIIAGFLARGLSPAEAAICGIHVAGTATDLYVEENAAGTMMAGDIIRLIPRVLSEW